MTGPTRSAATWPREHRQWTMPDRVDRIIILHGYAMTPQKMWFPWLHAELERRGYGVAVPAFPDPLRPSSDRWLKSVAPLAKTWDRRTVVIGHSIGGVVALRALEKIATQRIHGLILVGSPFASTLSVRRYTHFFDEPIDWWTVRNHAHSSAVIHAKDDPLVPYDHALRYQEALGATLTLRKKGGHFTEKKCEPLLRTLKKTLE